MNARQGIKCGEIEVKRGGIMAILVSGGRLTSGSIERLMLLKESKAEDAVILLEAEPYFDDGVAADVKIEIVNLQHADCSEEVELLEEVSPITFGSDLAGGTTGIDIDAEIKEIDRIELARQDAMRDEILELGSK